MVFGGHGSNPFRFGSCLAISGWFRRKDNTGIGNKRVLAGMKGGEARVGSWFRGPCLSASNRSGAWGSRVGRDGSVQ